MSLRQQQAVLAAIETKVHPLNKTLSAAVFSSMAEAEAKKVVF